MRADPMPAEGTYDYWKRFASCLLRSVWSVRCSGTERVPSAGPCLVVANHASWRDIPLLAVCIRRPLRFLALGGLLSAGSFGPLITSYLDRYTVLPRWLTRFSAPRLARFLAPRLKALGAIPLTSGHGFVRSIKLVLQQGGAVVVFAQGGIRRGVAEGSFRAGVGWIACTVASSGVDLAVVPVALLGTDKARLRSPLELRVGRPVSAGRGSGRAHAARFTGAIESEVRRLMGP